MPEKIITAIASAGATAREYTVAFLYIVAAIAGACGGCLVASQRLLHGRNLTALIFAAYGFAGLVLGLTGVIVVSVFTTIALSIETAFLLGLIFGVTGSASLAGMNVSARFLMRRLGIEVDVSIKRMRPAARREKNDE